MKLHICHFHTLKRLKSGRTRPLYKHIEREAKDLPVLLHSWSIKDMHGEFDERPLWSSLVDIYLWESSVTMYDQDQVVHGISFDRETLPVYWLATTYLSGESNNVRRLLHLWFSYNEDLVPTSDLSPAEWAHYLSLAGLHRMLRCPILLFPSAASDHWGRFLEPVLAVMKIERGNRVLDNQGRVGTVLAIDEWDPKYYVGFEDGRKEWTGRITPLRFVEALDPDRVPAQLRQKMADYTAVEEEHHG